jgi:hypothetical protein
MSTEDLDNLDFEADENWVGTTSFKWKGYNGIQYSSNEGDVEIRITGNFYEENKTLCNTAIGGLVAIGARIIAPHLSCKPRVRGVQGIELTEIANPLQALHKAQGRV